MEFGLFLIVYLIRTPWWWVFFSISTCADCRKKQRLQLILVCFFHSGKITTLINSSTRGLTPVNSRNSPFVHDLALHLRVWVNWIADWRFQHVCSYTTYEWCTLIPAYRVWVQIHFYDAPTCSFLSSIILNGDIQAYATGQHTGQPSVHCLDLNTDIKIEKNLIRKACDRHHLLEGKFRYISQSSLFVVSTARSLNFQVSWKIFSLWRAPDVAQRMNLLHEMFTDLKWPTTNLCRTIWSVKHNSLHS